MGERCWKVIAADQGGGEEDEKVEEKRPGQDRKVVQEVSAGHGPFRCCWSVSVSPAQMSQNSKPQRLS